MGSQHSKRTRDSSPVRQINGNAATTTAAAAAASSSTTAAKNNNMTQYMAELSSSYEAACQLDPDIQSFDATLRQRTSHAISTVAVGVDLRSLSFGTLSEVTGCLLDTNQEVLKIILECKKDIWKSPELFELVDEYFENSIQTLDFYTALENCLKKARNNQLIVQVALQHFEEEEKEAVAEEEGGGEKKYQRSLEELKHFKDAGDPFTEEFFELFQLVYKQQMAMLEKLLLRKNKLEKKLKAIKTWRKITGIIFAAAFAAVLICSVVAAALAAPPVASALAAASSIPLGSMGKWFYTLWKRYEDAVKGQSALIDTMRVGTSIAIIDLHSIRVLVDQLEIQIKSLLHATDFALRDEEAMKFGVEEIKKKLDVFMKSIQDLCEQADRCSRNIRRARTVILRKIINYPN